MSEVFFHHEGKEYCNEEKALSELLADDILFVGANSTDTVRLYVCCNDLFYWASADAEDLPQDEIGSLYKAWQANKKWGASIWCCKRRNLQPQAPVKAMMQKEGAWTDEVEALPNPEPS